MSMMVDQIDMSDLKLCISLVEVCVALHEVHDLDTFVRNINDTQRRAYLREIDRVAPLPWAVLEVSDAAIVQENL